MEKFTTTPRGRILGFALIFALIGATFISFSFAARPVDPQEMRGLRGEVAIDVLGKRLPDVARRYNMTPEVLRDLFLTDPTLEVDLEDNLLYVEPDISQEELDFQDQVDERALKIDYNGLDIAELPVEQEGVVASAVTPAPEDAFLLNSNPGAPLTIYLDFDGHVTTGTAWNRSTGIDPIVTRGFSLDADRDTFSEQERNQIINVWTAVAEDFIPYDVNVTTQDPGEEKLRKSSRNDQVYGIRIVVTPDRAWHGCSCGGVAYVGSFNNSTDTPAFAFLMPTSTYGSEKRTAEIISHEVGHTLGLRHDGTSSATYYRGHGIWAPIMGIGFDRALSQWSKGEYSGANNNEDDLRIMSGYIPYRADDAGNTIGSAKALGSSSDGTYFQQGIIGATGDIDVYSFSWGGGAFEMSAAQGVSYIITANLRGNLDPALRILNSSGQEVASSDPAGIVPAVVNINLPAGTYYAEVRGVGYLDPLNTGYSNYASLGSYIITGSASSTPPSPPADTTAPTVSLTAPTNGATVSGTVSVTASASDDVGVTKVEFLINGSVVSTDTTSPYTYSWNTTTIANGTVALTARAHDAAGNTTLSAQRSVTVNNVVADTTPPTVSLTSPTNGATVSGTVSLSANASDNVGVTKVEFLVNGNLLSTDTTSPYTASWDTSGLTNGSYTLRARAYDAAGNTTISSAVSVNVNNQAPPPTLVGDINGDGKVNLQDLSILLANWSKTVTPNTNGDLNGDGVVTLADLSLLLANWG